MPPPRAVVAGAAGQAWWSAGCPGCRAAAGHDVCAPGRPGPHPNHRGRCSGYGCPPVHKQHRGRRPCRPGVWGQSEHGARCSTTRRTTDSAPQQAARPARASSRCGRTPAQQHPGRPATASTTTPAPDRSPPPPATHHTKPPNSHTHRPANPHPPTRPQHQDQPSTCARRRDGLNKQGRSRVVGGQCGDGLEFVRSCAGAGRGRPRRARALCCRRIADAIPVEGRPSGPPEGQGAVGGPASVRSGAYRVYLRRGVRHQHQPGEHRAVVTRYRRRDVRNRPAIEVGVIDVWLRASASSWAVPSCAASAERVGRGRAVRPWALVGECADTPSQKGRLNLTGRRSSGIRALDAGAGGALPGVSAAVVVEGHVRAGVFSSVSPGRWSGTKR
jgi:hypothetical protein